MKFLFFICLKLPAICHKIFSMHVPICICCYDGQKAIHRTKQSQTGSYKPVINNLVNSV